MIRPDIYQALVVAQGLEFYKKTGIPINTAYTPKKMMATAKHILGDQFAFKSRDYLGAATALRQWVQEKSNEV